VTVPRRLWIVIGLAAVALVVSMAGMYVAWGNAKVGDPRDLLAFAACVVLAVAAAAVGLVGLEHALHGDKAVPHAYPWVIALVAVLAVAVVVAVGVILSHWDEKNPPNDEVVKACLNVITVTVLGAVVALLSASIEAARTARSDSQQQRQESFTLHTEMLTRSTRCAQGFFIACQHVRRQLNEADGERRKWETQRKRSAALALLDTEYRAFGTEALAIQVELQARFGKVWPRSYRWQDAPQATKAEQSYWRWHMVYDLLTIYYFALTGKFPGHSLTNNAIRLNEDDDTWVEPHSGFRTLDPYSARRAEPDASAEDERTGSPAQASIDAATILVVDNQQQPTVAEVQDIIDLVKGRIPRAIEEFTKSLFVEDWPKLQKEWATLKAPTTALRTAGPHTRGIY
jgi:hypothetical protein